MNKKTLLRVSLVLISIFLAVEIIGYTIGWCRFGEARDTKPIKDKKLNTNFLKSKNRLLKEEIMSLRPGGIYIVVDTASNILYLNHGKKTILKSTVSCGSGSILIDPSGKRQWIFETPRGEYSIQSKYIKPVWIKPDWAFIEESESIPKKRNDRIMDSVLGDYALGFGNGYFIHGTLYTRLLGRNVTHGCIRVGDKDLKTIYETVPVGAKILIF